MVLGPNVILLLSWIFHVRWKFVNTLNNTNLNQYQSFSTHKDQKYFSFLLHIPCQKHLYPKTLECQNHSNLLLKVVCLYFQITITEFTQLIVNFLIKNHFRTLSSILLFDIFLILSRFLCNFMALYWHRHWINHWNEHFFSRLKTV